MKEVKLISQVAWITGGASGMGRATAELFAAEGAKVAVVDVNQEQGRQVVDRINRSGQQAIFCLCDVAREAQVREAIQATVDQFGGLQIIVNCAGVAHAKLLHDTTEQEWDQLMGVNVKSIFFSIKYGLTHLRQHQHSYVVNIGSISSFVAQADTPGYTTSKGAVLSLSQSIALDYAHLGLRCNCVCPGITDTPMLRRVYSNVPDGDNLLARRLKRVPINRAIKPEEVARSVLFLSCEDSAGITGTSLTIDGGYLSAAEWDCDALPQSC